MKFLNRAGRSVPGMRALDISLVLGLIASVALPALPAQAGKTATAAKAHTKPTAKKSAKKPAAPAVLESDASTHVAEWIAATDDNGKLPFIVIDKQIAAMALYSADGMLLGRAPVLLGIAPGDEASPGAVGKTLAKLGPAEKTTPAGRYLAWYGKAPGHDKVLWVDYTNSVALHAVITTNPKERRLQRLQSPTADDNRISFGCINVPTVFYNQKVRPLFSKKGGMVYILPETKPVEQVFPLMRDWAIKNPTPVEEAQPSS